MAFRTLFFSLLALALLTTTVGCDSNDDDSSDADVFAGNWVVVGISDDEGDKTAGFGQLVDAATVNFTEGGSFTLDVDYNAAAEAGGVSDVTLSGTYVVDEGANTLSLNVGQLALVFDYAIQNNDRIQVTTNANLFNLALQLPPERFYVGDVTLTVSRIS